jgi:hypothetical protein
VSIFSAPQFGHMDKFSFEFPFCDASRSPAIAGRENLT